MKTGKGDERRLSRRDFVKGTTVGCRGAHRARFDDGNRREPARGRPTVRP